MKKLIGIIIVFSMAVISVQGGIFSRILGRGRTQEAVNIYSTRHYDTDQQLFELFEKQTGIKVNVLKGNADELIERIAREGKNTSADALITVDSGRLHRAKERGILQPIKTDILSKNVPDNVRDADNYWYGLTKRARVLVYAKDRVSPADLSTYEALTEDNWKGRVTVRTSENIYNLSLLASFIEIYGEEEAKRWAEGIVKNMSREPRGNDRDQAKAVAAGQGDVAIMNTYYIGAMLNSVDPEEVYVAESLGIFFPNQETTGTHINVSGIGVTKYGRNTENAIKLVEFLSGVEAQEKFAMANYEYPVNPEAKESELVKSWGDFKGQDINLTALGENNNRASEIFVEANWK